MHTGVCTYFSYFIDFCARAFSDVEHLPSGRRDFGSLSEIVSKSGRKKKKKPDFSLLRYPLTAARQTIIIIWHSIFLSLNRQQLGGGGWRRGTRQNEEHHTARVARCNRPGISTVRTITQNDTFSNRYYYVQT